jgi:protein-S-isoprenylcysteine O-methyltransferase Ste14
MVKAIFFVVISAGNLWLSRQYLRRPNSYGFYRFFAFETILGLVLLNVNRWFSDPFSILQIPSWVSLIGSALLAIHGFHLLRVIGQPEGSIEETTRVVQVGAYRYIRHPLYASLLLFAIGAFLKDISLLAGILLVVSCVFLYATARVEERQNIDIFGAEYAAYMQRTKMFIPYVL